MKLTKKTKLLIFIFLISTVTCFETASESEDKISNKINISIGKIKIKKSLKNTQPGAAISPTAQISSSTLNDAVSRSGNLAMTSNVLDVATQAGLEEPDPYQIDLTKGPIFFTAWIKFFKYAESDLNGAQPKSFFKNNQYYEQMKLFPNANMNDSSSDGLNTLSTYIKQPAQFYAVLFKENLNFLTSRQIQLQKTYDVLNIHSIRPVVEEVRIGKNLKDNGIQDFGDFSEGFCFKVLTEKPRFETWIICTETKEEKNKLMEFLRRIKIREQRDRGLIIEGKKEEETLSSLLNPNMGITQNLTSDQSGNLGVTFNATTQKITDGYWIVLQDWSQCNLKCGGGTSTLQRMCVPPKNGGAPCQGDAIITKPCNIQPCPNVYSTNPLTPTNTTTVNKPIIKVMPFSNRPQRYSKCVIKESDLMLNEQFSEEDENSQSLKQGASKLPEIQIPVRVIMNNRTVIILAGEDYHTQVKTFSLRDTYFKRSNVHQSCFVLKEGKKMSELCPYFGCNKPNQLLEEWDYDFNLFKYQCFKPRDTLDLDLEAKLQEKINNAKRELLEERENELKRKEEPNDIEIKQTNQVALQAIQKELDLEAMIRKEEQEKEQQEEVLLLQQIEDEKRKSDCLMRAIKERELENQYNLRSKQNQEEVSQIKNSAAQQVLIRRSQLKNQIMKMRKDAQRRRSSLNQKLMTVRNVMAENMNKAYKKGDSGKCKTAMQGQSDRENYCDANFVDDPDMLQNCKDADEFCSLCCETEFGEMFISERQKCYKDICTTPIAENLVGRWQWQNEIAKK